MSLGMLGIIRGIKDVEEQIFFFFFFFVTRITDSIEIKSNSYIKPIKR